MIIQDDCLVWRPISESFFIKLKSIFCEIFTVSNAYTRFLCTKNMTCNHEWYIYKILWANYKDKNDKHQFDLFYEQRQDVEKKDVKSDDKKSVIILDQQNLVLITSSSNVSIYHENVGCTWSSKICWVEKLCSTNLLCIARFIKSKWTTRSGRNITILYD